MSFTSDYDLLPPISKFQAASRFDALFDAYGLSLKQQEPRLEHRTITLIARSPASPPAQALSMNLGRFQPLSIEVKIIFAQIAPADALNFVLQSLAASCRSAPEEIIRWAKNRALLEAHERLLLGRTLCWTGDSMRRSEDSRSAIDRVEEGTDAMLTEADSSFAALWQASVTLPKNLLSRGPVPLGQPVVTTFSTTDMAVERSIVWLDDYLRFRRH